MLKRIQLFNLLNPTPLPHLRALLPSLPSLTPRKVADIDALTTHIYGLMMQQNVDSQILTAFEKMRKAAIAGLHAGAQAEDQLHNMEVAKQAREAQSKQGKKVVAHTRGGPIYVNEARKTVKSREQKEIEKDNRYLVQL